MYGKQILRSLATLAIAIALLFAGSALAFTPDSSSEKVISQAGTLFNSHTVSATDTAVVVTMTGVPSQSVHIYSVDAVCSTGTSSITIGDDGTKFATLAAEVTTTRLRISWAIPYTGATGGTVTITLAACGSGNTGTLTVQADQY